MKLMLEFCVCFGLGLMVAALILVGLMFAGEMGLIQNFLLTGKPLAHLALEVLPGEFWLWLTGVESAAANPSVRSFLSLCVALAQVGLLLALLMQRGMHRS
ncbi:hypothetical protein BZL41_23935 [Pseudomonas sp. PIC25]|uniref:hypothetical protein n=1 Tax=Pseudomonas sp. PIC25 TaxID=1958773 RepID=UPI000BABC60F|nr:hypothetical protein [Pseudomonas sp. PIC25]PAU52973.1 hypothetical protein BZL41_23935 [Pseudomonas sp. PIC25]